MFVQESYKEKEYLTLKMTSAQVVETSVKVTSNSPSQDYTHPDDHNLPTYDNVIIVVVKLISVISKFFPL